MKIVPDNSVIYSCFMSMSICLVPALTIFIILILCVILNIYIIEYKSRGHRAHLHETSISWFCVNPQDNAMLIFCLDLEIME